MGYKQEWYVSQDAFVATLKVLPHSTLWHSLDNIMNLGWEVNRPRFEPSASIMLICSVTAFVRVRWRRAVAVTHNPKFILPILICRTWMDRAVGSVSFCAYVVTFMGVSYPLRVDIYIFFNIDLFCVMGINLLDACMGVMRRRHGCWVWNIICILMEWMLSS